MQRQTLSKIAGRIVDQVLFIGFLLFAAFIVFASGLSVVRAVGNVIEMRRFEEQRDGSR